LQVHIGGFHDSFTRQLYPSLPPGSFEKKIDRLYFVDFSVAGRDSSMELNTG
jgi:hypothetical protein